MPPRQQQGFENVPIRARSGCLLSGVYIPRHACGGSANHTPVFSTALLRQHGVRGLRIPNHHGRRSPKGSKMADRPISIMAPRGSTQVRSASTNDLVAELTTREVTPEEFARLVKVAAEPLPLRHRGNHAG